MKTGEGKTEREIMDWIGILSILFVIGVFLIVKMKQPG